MSISAFTEVKRIPLLIESLACLGSFYLKWVHIGGSFEFEPAKEYAKKLLTPKANITFEFKGELKNEEVLEFLCRESVDVLINVSSNEGI
ncbi:MAG: glycosyl transferase family 1, partial [Bacteroidota bacterium]